MSTAAKPPTISAVITVHNKAAQLPDTIRSLRRQTDDQAAVEYIFVDDGSTDPSVQVVRDLMADAPHVRIIGNTDNRGPSIRLNQGVAAAGGDVLYFLDGDDIAAAGAMGGMLQRLRAENAGFIYGRTAKPAHDKSLFDIAADPTAPHKISDTPLDTVLGGGFVRMALMCRRDLYLAAGGADERIFVQDESLPIRLAMKATRMIAWQATVIAVPPATDDLGRVSRNRDQLHHDAFLAYDFALRDLDASQQHLAPKLYARAVSAFWKYARRKPGGVWREPGFWRYLQAKALQPPPRPVVLDWMRSELMELSGIRRM